MPLLADAGKNRIVDALFGTPSGSAVTHLSLHTAYSATGTNEVAGGSYARQAVTMNAASGGQATVSGTPSFSVPSGNTVRWLGLWTASTAGTFMGMVPNGSTIAVSGVLNDTTADTFECDAHGFSNDDTIVLIGNDLPTGVTEGTVYYVINATTDDFQVSLTQGGAAVAITGKGTFIAMNIVEESFGADGTLNVSTFTTGLNLLD